MSVVGGGAVCGGAFTHDDGMDGEGWTESGAGRPYGAGFKCD